MKHLTEIKVRNSELVDFASCRKKYQLVWIQGIRPKKGDPKLQIGSLVHKFLEVYEMGQNEAAGRNAMLDLFMEFGKKLPGYSDKLESLEFLPGFAEAKKSYDFAHYMVDNYLDYRDTMDLATMVQSEGQFEVPLANGVILTGTLDGLVRDADDNWWIREYKTCQSIKDKLRQYTLDRQTRRYVDALTQQGINVRGVELVLLAKILPPTVDDFLLKAKEGEVPLISKDMDKWNKANPELAKEVARQGKFTPEGAGKGLTEKGFHDILKILEAKDNPFFRVERLFFNETELAIVNAETIEEGQQIMDLRNRAAQAEAEGVPFYGWTRNPGTMGMNCKSCSVRVLCEMELKGVDTSLVLQEHYDVVDPHAPEVAEDDEDEGDLGSES